MIFVEVQYGRSTLQNLDGLLMSSLLASQLAPHWRGLLALLKPLPLALGIGYKQFQGGTSMTVTAPPGFQNHGGGTCTQRWNAVLANFTQPFMEHTTDGIVAVPIIATAYGFNTVLLSNTSVATIDGPSPERVLDLQETLAGDSAMHFTGMVRGTVVKFNLVTGDEQCWEKTFSIRQGLRKYLIKMTMVLGSVGDECVPWNESWILIESMNCHRDMPPDWEGNQRQTIRIFLQRAMRFDIKRYNCTGIWKITRSSVGLTSGNCDEKPLDSCYQYYDDARLDLDGIVGRQGSIVEYVSFDKNRENSQWLVPATAAVLSAAYQSRVAASFGQAPIRRWGSVWNVSKLEAKLGEDGTTHLPRDYLGEQKMFIEVPTLGATWALYLILALQPAMTVLALIITHAHFRAPISRQFCLVSLLAGIDRDSLDVLKGAGFSGELTRSVGIGIAVPDAPRLEKKLGHLDGSANVRYFVGDGSKMRGAIQRGQTYG